MISWFSTPFNSTILIVLAIGYHLVASVTRYDIRLLLSHKNDSETPEKKILPKWIGLLHWIEGILLVAMLLLNWKFALITWLIKAVFQALMILDFICFLIITTLNLRRD
jgi:hypothetical protein